MAFRPFGEVSASTCHPVTQSVGDLFHDLKARPAVRLRSWSKAGCAASVLERGRLCGFGFGARTRPAPGPHQARTRPAPGFFRAKSTESSHSRCARGYNDLTDGVGQIKFPGPGRDTTPDLLENFRTDRRKFRPQRPAGVRRVGESHIVL